ncbi:DALR anticodon-binding domain-containing protein [Thermobifida halotolerans]|uniref:DALR anticodon-binding domain-containing protein n=1 Tax=Thermobifida halotolerans TaxID=483545 RepID=UPI0008382BEE|nr:DALR anticodon-binding domain-containing protein [Thermobifida halotolerans]
MAAPAPAAAAPRELDGLLRRACAAATGIPSGELPDAPTRRSANTPGEYTSALPLRLAGPTGRDARDLAADVAARLRHCPQVVDARVDGPGFVTVALRPAARAALAPAVAGDPGGHLLGLPPRHRRSGRADLPPGWALSSLERAPDPAGARAWARADARRRLALAVGTATAADVAAALAEPTETGWRDVPQDASVGETARLLALTGTAGARVAFCRSAADQVRPGETTGPDLPALPTPEHPGAWARATHANPAFAVRYAHAHARTACERWAAALGRTRAPAHRTLTEAETAALTDPAAERLLGALFDAPAALQAATRRNQPHILVRYLEGLAAAYHDWWESHDVLSGRAADTHGPRAETTAARLDACAAVAGVLHAGLALVGVSAPTRL